MSSSRLAWGILGTGHIAEQFAAGLAVAQRSELAAVGSRKIDTARAFAQRHGSAQAHGSYESLLADKSVHAVYNSLPNSLHHEWTIKALKAGKHVLCEKPLASNLAQAQEMFDEARRAGKLLTEAFMYRSHPMTLALLRTLAEGAIGQLRMIRTAFVFSASKVAGNVRFSEELAGGSLMDVGCYCLSYSRLLAGAEPTSLSAVAHLHETRVDDYVAGVMAFPGDIVAHFCCGITVRGDNTAHLMGTEGYIEIPVPWKPPLTSAEFTVVDAQGHRKTTRVSANTHLYALEADDFAHAILNNIPPRVSESDSLGNQRCLDILRHQIGVKV